SGARRGGAPARILDENARLGCGGSQIGRADPPAPTGVRASGAWRKASSVRFRPSPNEELDLRAARNTQGGRFQSADGLDGQGPGQQEEGGRDETVEVPLEVAGEEPDAGLPDERGGGDDHDERHRGGREPDGAAGPLQPHGDAEERERREQLVRGP